MSGQTINTFAVETSELMKPLQEFLDIKLFSFIRFFSDNTVVIFSNNNELYQHFFDHSYLLSSGTPEQIVKPNFLFQFNAASNHHYSDEINDMANIFNIDHVLDHIIIAKDHYDLFRLGTDKQNHNMSNEYLNNINYIKRFNLAFKNNICGIIERKKCKRIPLNKKMCNSQLNALIQERTYPIKVQQQEKIYNISLTLKEYECCQLLINGHTNLEIAQFMYISHRTVEFHINNVKEKLGLKSRNELGVLLRIFL